MNLTLILIILVVFYLFLSYLTNSIPSIYSTQPIQIIHPIQSETQIIPTYYKPSYSILDTVPPPDPHHEYRCNNFSKESTGYTDYDRWINEWSPDAIII